MTTTTTERELVETVIDGFPEPMKKFTVLEDFEVDGIWYRNPRFVYGKLMFTIKDEFTDNGEAEDTGPSHFYMANLNVSENHWLKCGVIVPVGGYCSICEGKISD